METTTYTDAQGNQVTEQIDDNGNVINRTVVSSGSSVGIMGGNVENCTVVVNGRRR